MQHLNIESGVGEFTSSTSCIFEKGECCPTCSLSFDVCERVVSKLNSLMWCVNSNGYIEIFVNDERLGVLSGNGRFEFNMTYTPKVKVTAKAYGFEDFDSFTLILSGKS